MTVLAHRFPFWVNPLPFAAAIGRLAPTKWLDYPMGPIGEGCQAIVLFRASSELLGLTSDSLPLDPEVAASFTHLLGDIWSRIHGDPLRAGLIKITGGGRIHPHFDADFASDSTLARVHFVIATDPAVYFIIDGQKLQLRDGEVWALNVGLLHEVHNFGTTDRVHLVIDLVKDNEFEKLLKRSHSAKKWDPSSPGQLDNGPR